MNLFLAKIFKTNLQQDSQCQMGIRSQSPRWMPTHQRVCARFFSPIAFFSRSGSASNLRSNIGPSSSSTSSPRSTCTQIPQRTLGLVASLAVLAITGNAGAATSSAFLSTGHREAMMANGGSTDLCSSGQFALNPAGVFCPAKAGYSESFGSANLSALNASTRQGGLNEMGAGLRTSSGLSMFSQGTFTESSAFGFWAVINPLSMSRSFTFSQSQVDGVFEWSTTQNETSVGPFVAGKYRDIYWGATLALTQTETNLFGVSKFKTTGGDTIAGITKTNSVEQALSAKTGLICDQVNHRYSAVISSPSMSLRGSARSDTTSIGTANTFKEESQRGSQRTSDSGSLLLGLEFTENPLQRWGIDAAYMSATEVNSDLSEVSEKSPALVSVGANFQKVFTEKITLLAGLRHSKSIETTERISATGSEIVSFGILRRYKGVELGSGFGYTHFANESNGTADPKNASSSTLDRFDITFSSTFTY